MAVRFPSREIVAALDRAAKRVGKPTSTYVRDAALEKAGLLRAARIAVDYECNAEPWWDAARAGKAPAVVRPLLSTRGPDEIMVSRDEAAAVLAWASSLPGWDDGPAHARRPLVIGDVFVETTEA